MEIQRAGDGYGAVARAASCTFSITGTGGEPDALRSEDEGPKGRQPVEGIDGTNGPTCGVRRVSGRPRD